MSKERYDLFRLYMANMEQYMVIRKVFRFALVILGAIGVVYSLVFLRNTTSLWITFLTVLFFYFIAGDFIVGAMVFGPPNRTIKWVARQKMKEPDYTSAGELAAGAAKLLRNGNVSLARELVNQAFQLKDIGGTWLIFANTVRADLLRAEGELEESIKTLKRSVLRKKKDAGSYSFLVLGRAYLQQGNYRKAIEALEDASALQKEGDIGIPDVYKSRSKNRTMRNFYGETLQVFIPFYLGKAYFWGAEGKEQAAAEKLNSAVILCRNRHLRPLLKEEFAEKE